MSLPCIGISDLFYNVRGKLTFVYAIHAHVYLNAYKKTLKKIIKKKSTNRQTQSKTRTQTWRDRQTFRHVYDTQTGRQTHKTYESLLAKQRQCYRIQYKIHNTIINRCIIKDSSTIYRSKEAQPLKYCMISPLDCMTVSPISR